MSLQEAIEIIRKRSARMTDEVKNINVEYEEMARAALQNLEITTGTLNDIAIEVSRQVKITRVPDVIETIKENTDSDGRFNPDKLPVLINVIADANETINKTLLEANAKITDFKKSFKKDMEKKTSNISNSLGIIKPGLRKDDVNDLTTLQSYIDDASELSVPNSLAFLTYLQSIGYGVTNDRS